MEANTLSKIAVRILAIYLMASGFMQIPNIITVFSNTRGMENENNIILFTFFSVVLIPILIGFVLWFASEKLGVLITGKETESEAVNLTNPQIQTVIISSIGLTIAVLTLPELVRYLYQVLSITEVVDKQKVYDAYNMAYLLGACLKFILGISLAFGTQFWLKLLHYFRELGISAKTSNKAIKKDV